MVVIRDHFVTLVINDQDRPLVVLKCHALAVGIIKLPRHIVSLGCEERVREIIRILEDGWV